MMKLHSKHNPKPSKNNMKMKPPTQLKKEKKRKETNSNSSGADLVHWKLLIFKAKAPIFICLYFFFLRTRNPHNYTAPSSKIFTKKLSHPRSASLFLRRRMRAILTSGGGGEITQQLEIHANGATR
ncbi:hypothetical protein ACOSQ2_013841 [Xanthoceras sorbifolium]